MRIPLCLLLLLLLIGCGGPSAKPRNVWGKRGVIDGEFLRPRAIAIDREDRIFIVDFAARIQVFKLDGSYLGPTWSPPDFRNGRPSGLGIDREGNLILCDSHYSTIRIYNAKGEELRHFTGDFGYISDAVQDAEGNFYISEFGVRDRISVLDNDGKLLRHWGETGGEPGQLNRVRALTFGPDGNLYVADACNHRIQVFSKSGDVVRIFGESGSEPGRLSYPYDVAFSPNGDLYVAEYGNHRVQRFSPTGEPKGTWGTPGRKPGQLANPWALAIDRRGRIHVVDTENHRIQSIDF